MAVNRDTGMLNFFGEEKAVGPTTDGLKLSCQHLEQVIKNIPQQKVPGVKASMKCAECSSLENYLCLTCFTVRCGRFTNKHMLKHSFSTRHSIVVHLTKLHVWCYTCECYLDIQNLLKEKDMRMLFSNLNLQLAAKK